MTWSAPHDKTMWPARDSELECSVEVKSAVMSSPEVGFHREKAKSGGRGVLLELELHL